MRGYVTVKLPAGNGRRSRTGTPKAPAAQGDRGSVEGAESVGLSDRGAARGLPGPATAGPAVGVSTGGAGPAKLGQGTGLLLADRQSVGEHLAKLLGPHHRHRPRIRASR